MKVRSRLRVTCAGTLLVGCLALAAPASAQQSVANWAVDTSANTASNSQMFDNMGAALMPPPESTPYVAAAPPGMPLKAPPPPADGPWWFHGYVEVGGRTFINNPQDGGSRWQGGGQSSLAKYYEYSTIKPGAFGDFWFATGSRNGLYEADLWGKNVGYDDQRYIGDFSKAGEHYLNLGWDQTPHVYSDGAQTLYNGVGGTSLSLPAGLSNLLFGAAGCVYAGRNTAPTGCPNPIAPANAAAVRTDILNNLQTVGLGIQRNTASVDYRYTPTDAWDFRVNYTNTTRTGTQVDGVVFSSSTSGVVAQVPRPVHDTTQNYGGSGEYAGTSPWNQKFNVKVGYAGSTYTDDFNSYTVDNPFCSSASGLATGADCARTGAPSSFQALMSTMPSNQANAVTTTLGADLPWASRYMGTVSYTMMRQNDQFNPFTGNTGLTGTINGANPASLAALPAQSLNGQINTTLINNVLTTQITKDLKSKASYRYYDFDNGTNELFFVNWIQSDVGLASTNGGHAPLNSISIGYTKQNAGYDLVWQPTREWNLGAAWAYERYDWARADANVTNENSAKFFADWKPTGWLTMRNSFSYGLRRFDEYNAFANFGSFQFPNAPGEPGTYPAAYRQMMFDNRDRTVAKIAFDIALSQTVTLSPTLSYHDDWYRIDPTLLNGLDSYAAIDAGIELDWVASPDTTFLVSYMNERVSQRMSECTAGTNGTTPCVGSSATASIWQTDDQETVNTVVLGVNHTFIPDKFELKASYTLSAADDHQPWNVVGGPAATNNNSTFTLTQFPDVKTYWQRLDLTGVYTFDQDFVQKLGWKGVVKAKLRYAWERNSVMNWQNDTMTPYMYANATGSNAFGYMTFMAYDNPNYNVQMIAASIVAGW